MRLPVLAVCLLGANLASAQPQSAPTAPAIKHAPGTFGPRLLFEELRPAVPLAVSEAAMLRRLIAATPQQSADRLPLLFRLADHTRAAWLDQARRERTAGSQLSTSRSPLERARLRRARQDAEQRSRPLLVEATRLMVQVATSTQPFVRRDEALFLAADLLRLGQQPQQARALVVRLIKDYPTSRYIPDSYLVLGEHFFAAGQYREALQLYRRAALHPTAACRGYALYKTGWASLHLGDARGGLESLLAAHRVAEAARHTALLAEARRGMVIAYANVGAPSKAAPFFARVAASEAPALLRQLAAIYRASGRPADAAVVVGR